ncbi:MAG: exodeoxyribonuclease VII large subunit [Candidatus Aminicenantales bacterium]
MDEKDRPEKIYTVSEITRLIKRELEDRFFDVWVEGEIADFKRAHSGHLYFTLKDEGAQLHCVMWRSDAQRVVFELETGLHVVLKGRVSVYEPRGQYQLLVERVEPKGKGALQLAFEQLKEKLRKEGLFDEVHKKKLPLLPKRVGVVTSPRGAAIIDIIRTLERRFARLHILIYPVKVQGEGAAEEIVEGIDVLGRMPGVDVVIVGRGGGSLEDLWAFNEEQVARAIFRCPVPVISAVGHEIDFTIADFVADIRASTPSAAAEMVVEKEEAFVERIENLSKRLTHQLQYTIQAKKHEVMDLIHHTAFQNFRVRLYQIIQRVDDLENRAGHAVRSMIQNIRESRSRAALLEEKLVHTLKRRLQDFLGTWERLSAQLHNLSPLNVLKKGYTICWKASEPQLIQHIEDVVQGEDVTVSFFKGEFTAEVRGIDRKRLVASRLKKPET